MDRSRLSLVGVVAFLLAAELSAHADRVAVLVPQIKPWPAEKIRDRFHDSLIGGFKGLKDGTAIAGKTVRSKLGDQPDLMLCLRGPCIGKAASLLKADRVVITEINQIGKTYAVRSRAVASDGTHLAGPVIQTCDVCTVREASEAMRKLGEEVANRLAGSTTGVAAAGSPEQQRKLAMFADEDDGPGDANVAASEPAAAAPVTVPTIETTAPAGATPAPVPGATATAPTAASVDEPGVVPYRPLAYAAFGLAAASLAATIAFGYFAAREDDPSCDLPNPTTSCPEIYSGNVGPAVGFGVVTAVAAGAGGLLLYLDSREKRKNIPVVTAVPLRDGFALSARLRF